MAVSNVELRVDARNAVQALKKASDESKKLETAAKGVTSATTKVGREMKTAANGMQYFIDAAGRARKANGQFVTTAEAAAAGLEGQGTAAKAAASSFDGLAKKAAGLAAAYLSLNAAQNAFREGIQRIESERRIQFLAQGYGEVEQLQDAATKAAKRFGTGQTEANRALADVFARLRPVGVELEDIVSVYNGFNTAARISGSTAVESANAFRQLSQALGSGALRGDEFNSISEQVPGILTAISAETGVAQGSLRKFAADGKITADVVIRALKRIETEGAAQLEAALGGPAQAIADFQNAAEDVQVALTKDIVPQMAQVFRGLAELIVNLEEPIRFIGGVAANTLNQINSLITQATKPAAFAARRDIEAGLIPTNIVAGFTGGDVRGGAKELFGEAGLKELETRAREFADLRGEGFQETLLQFMQDRLKTMDAAAASATQTLPTVPNLPKPPPISKKTRRTGRDPADILADQIKAGDEILEQQNRKLELAEQETKFQQQLLQIEYKRQDEAKRILQTTADFQQQQLLLRNDAIASDEMHAAIISKVFDDTNKAVSEQKRLLDIRQQAQDKFKAFFKDVLQKEAAKMNQIYASIGQSIQTGIVDSLTAAVDGTKKLADVAADTLRSVANILLQFGVNTALGGLSTVGGTGSIFDKLFGGFRASGGSVKAGSSYMVGERGPELFTPGRSGSIAPSGSFGGANVVVNVDASGTQAQGNRPNAKLLGQAIGAAVQAELIKQKRPGGLLAV